MKYVDRGSELGDVYDSPFTQDVDPYLHRPGAEDPVDHDAERALHLLDIVTFHHRRGEQEDALGRVLGRDDDRVGVDNAERRPP